MFSITKKVSLLASFLVSATLLTGCTEAFDEAKSIIKDEVTTANTKPVDEKTTTSVGDLYKYNQQATKYKENVVTIKPTATLTKEQLALIKANGTDYKWEDYRVSKKGLPTQATALVTYDGVLAHSSKTTKRPSFKSDVHVAGEYKDGKYDPKKDTWYSPGRMKSNNQQLQLGNYRGYLYNKSHLIAWSLGGDMEAHNVILGTRSQNVGTNYSKAPGGMSEIETLVRDKVYQNKNLKVFYQAVPVYKGKEIVPRGVYVRAYSVNDDGKSINKAIYTLNTQDGVTINYNDGTWTQH